MDPSSTPPHFKVAPFAAEHLVRVSKSIIIAMIQNTPFEEILLPRHLVNDDPDNIVPFIEALGATLIKTMISKSPVKTSPQRLIVSLTPHHDFPPEQETPTKPRVMETSKGNWTKRIHSDRLETKALKAETRFEQESAFDKKRREMLDSISDKPNKRSSTLCSSTLTWTEHKYHPLPRVLPFELEPLSDYDTPPEVNAKRMEWLKEIDLDKDPYYIARLERKPNEHLPHLFVQGEVVIPKDRYGNIPAGSTKNAMRRMDWHCWITEPTVEQFAPIFLDSNMT